MKKHIVLIVVAILAWACDNQTVRHQSTADDLFGLDEDSLLAEESPDTDTEGDKWWEDAPNTLPDTTVATCGNGVIDEGEECDGSAIDGNGQRILMDCANLDAEIYSANTYQTFCDDKWCIWDRPSCVGAQKEFKCPQGYVGDDCKKCASEYQDLDKNGTCEFSCSAKGLAFFTGDPSVPSSATLCGEHSVGGHGCEYHEGKPVCSCDEGWKRDDKGSCTINE